MKSVLILLYLLISFSVLAEPSGAYEETFDQKPDILYKRAHTEAELQSNGFNVMYEIYMLEKPTRFVNKNAGRDFKLN